jgi:hypothetical protein
LYFVAVPLDDLDRMIAVSMKDIPSDEEFSDGEDADLVVRIQTYLVACSF